MEEGGNEPSTSRQIIIDQESNNNTPPINPPKGMDAKEYLEGYQKRNYIEDFCKLYGNTIDINVKSKKDQSLDHKVLKKGVQMTLRYLKGAIGKMKICLGILLRSKTTGVLRYYYPGQATVLLPDLFTLETISDGRLLLRILKEIDLDHILNRQYIESDWEFVQICNVRFLTYFQR